VPATGLRRWWPAIVLAVVLVLAALAVAYFRSDGGNAGASAVDHPVRPVLVHATGASAVPRSWTRYTDPSGFSLSLPPGWSESSRNASQVTFAGPESGFVVLVAWTTHPQASQLADWRQLAAGDAASDPTYHQIGITPVRYRGYDAADWQFTNVYHDELTQVTDLGFIVHPGQLAYAVELYGPAAQFAAVHASIWSTLLASFTPAR
jgi:hypothetical protein